MRIAVVRQTYNPFGGAERFVERALAALQAQQVDVTLITRRWTGVETSGSQRLIRCDPFYLGRLWRDWSFARCVRRTAAREGFDLLQSHERIPGCDIFRAGDGVHAAWLAQRSRVLSPLQRLGQRLAPYHRYLLAAEKAMFAHPALRAVICNSHLVAGEIQRHYGLPAERLHVIYNGVDTEMFHPRLAEEFRPALRQRLAIPATAPLLLFVGGGFERKGVPQLLPAVAAMQTGDAHVVIVGGDRRLEHMQHLAARLGVAARVHFTGPQQDVRPYYGAADGFVLPTLYDPCPNAALEAMACGLPIVTSTSCGAGEWVRSGANGWVTDALDLHALAARLDDLCALSTGPQRLAARQAARDAVAAYTLDAMAARLQGLYTQLAATVPAARAIA